MARVILEKREMYKAGFEQFCCLQICEFLSKLILGNLMSVTELKGKRGCIMISACETTCGLGFLVGSFSHTVEARCAYCGLCLLGVCI